MFFLHPKVELIIIEDKMEQRLQIGRRQLNNIRYNMHKKLCMVTAPHNNKFVPLYHICTVSQMYHNSDESFLKYFRYVIHQ